MATLKDLELNKFKRDGSGEFVRDANDNSAVISEVTNNVDVTVTAPITVTDITNTVDVNVTSPVAISGDVEVTLSGEVDSFNSSSTPLSAGGAFVGSAVEVIHYSMIYVNVYTDVDSAPNGLHVQFSSDGTTWREGQGDLFTIPATTEKTYSFQTQRRYYRVAYRNGGTDQTVFDLQTILKKVNGKPSSHRVKDTISGEDDAELNVVVIKGKNGDDYDNVNITTQNALQTTSIDTSGNEIFTPNYPASVTLPLTYFDAFGRLQVAQGLDLFDNVNVRTFNPWIMYQKLVGSGTVTYNYDESAVELATTTASGDRAIRQSRHVPYVPAKGQYIDMTGIITESGADTNCVRRIGYFDDNNGIYFEHDGTNFSVNIRSNVSGSVVNTKVTQSNFNIDKLDGTGVSGITADFTKCLIYQIEFQWLGVGTVFFTIVIDGKPYRIHQQNHANSVTTVYMRTPALPIRYEIENTGVVSGSQTLKEICCAVGTSGTLKIPQKFWSVGHDDTFPLNGNDGESDILVLRLKDVFDPDGVTGITENRITAFLKNVLYYTQVDNVRFRLIKIIGNISATGNINLSTDFTSVNTNSACEFFTWDGSGTKPLISGDYIHTLDDRVVKGGNSTVGTSAFTAEGLDEQFIISQNIDSDESQYFVIRATNLESGNTETSASFSWDELE